MPSPSRATAVEGHRPLSHTIMQIPTRRYRLLAMHPQGMRYSSHPCDHTMHCACDCVCYDFKHARAMNPVERGRAGRTARVCMHMRVHIHAAVQRVVYGQRWQHAPLARMRRRKACQKAKPCQNVAPKRRKSEAQAPHRLRYFRAGAER